MKFTASAAYRRAPIHIPSRRANFKRKFLPGVCSDAEPLDFNETLARMTKAAVNFNPDKITVANLTRSGGPPEEIE